MGFSAVRPPPDTLPTWPRPGADFFSSDGVFLFQAVDDGLDGGVRRSVLFGEGFLDFTHGQTPVFPELFHYLQFGRRKLLTHGIYFIQVDITCQPFVSSLLYAANRAVAINACAATHVRVSAGPRPVKGDQDTLVGQTMHSASGLAKPWFQRTARR